MNTWRVLEWMRNPRVCEHTDVSIPECSCRECCRALVSCFAPALLDDGPLDHACGVSIPAIRTVEQYADIHGISVGEVRRRSRRLEVSV
jgi:hypothetical protein